MEKQLEQKIKSIVSPTICERPKQGTAGFDKSPNGHTAWWIRYKYEKSKVICLSPECENRQQNHIEIHRSN